MSISASQITEDLAQIDGRRHITERHEDHLGEFHFVRYLGESDTDEAAVMAARVPTLEANLAAGEIAKDLAIIMSTEPGGDYSGVTAQHNTLAIIRAALRAFYQVATGEQVGRMAAFLLTLSDAQLQTLFGLPNQSQVNQLKSRLQSRVDDLNAVLTAAGE